MLIYLLVQIPLTILNALTSFFPKVDSLPLGLDGILTQGMGYLFFLFTVIPPLGLLYDAFLIVITFKIGVMVFKTIPILGRMFI